MKINFTIKLLFSLVFSFFIVLLSSCGGHDEDAFDQLLNLTPTDELIGTWAIGDTATDYTCTIDGETEIDEDDVFDFNFFSFSDMITITQDACDVEGADFLDDEGLSGTQRCAAGEDQVIVELSASGSEYGCSLSGQATYNLEYDSETNSLIGSFSGEFNISGTCDDDGEDHSAQCQWTGTAVGTLETTTTDITTPTHIDGDVTDPLSSGISSTEDYDGDGIVDTVDNCWTIYNPLQNNRDGDAWGDVCELAYANQADADEDGWADDEDNCLIDFNEDQLDTDNDGVGDLCDNCVSKYNYDQLDSDGDGEGDACEVSEITDQDADGIEDQFDNCALIPNPDQLDADGDYVGDACDGDRDGDGLCDSESSVLCTKTDPDGDKKNFWFYVDTSITTAGHNFFLAGDYTYLPGSKDSTGTIVVDGVQSSSDRETYRRCPGQTNMEYGVCVREKVNLPPYSGHVKSRF